MKTQIFILLLIVVTLAACNKYDEGPMISLRKVETRVAQDFELVEFTKNGVDMTQELTDSLGSLWTFLDLRIYGTENNLKIYHINTNTYAGSYDVSKNKKDISIVIDGGASIPYNGMIPFEKHTTYIWEIERLTKGEMWLSCTYNDADYYLKFKD